MSLTCAELTVRSPWNSSISPAAFAAYRRSVADNEARPAPTATRASNALAVSRSIVAATRVSALGVTIKPQFISDPFPSCVTPNARLLDLQSMCDSQRTSQSPEWLVGSGRPRRTHELPARVEAALDLLHE